MNNTVFYPSKLSDPVMLELQIWADLVGESAPSVPILLKQFLQHEQQRRMDGCRTSPQPISPEILVRNVPADELAAACAACLKVRLMGRKWPSVVAMFELWLSAAALRVWG